MNMNTKLTEQVNAILKDIYDPYLEKNWFEAQVLKNVAVAADVLKIIVELHYPAQSEHLSWKELLIQKVKEIVPQYQPEIIIQTKIFSHAMQTGVKSIPGVKNIIAIASGKGGVGKSTTAVNLALALSFEGAKVGILDADIYGPSQPLMLNVQNKQPQVSEEGKLMYPIESYGLQSMSIGYLVGEEQPVIWRGPMVSGALQQLLTQTLWHDLDYLIVDLPPGTGDIHLTLVQKIPVSGAVIVTTPQDLALIDAQRACAMFEKVNVTVLGIIENMTSHVCSACGHTEAIFGEGGAQRLAQKAGVALLGQLPLDKTIRNDADAGKPTVALMPESPLGLRYRECARRVAAKLSLRPRNYGAVFPNIVVESR